MSIQSAFNQIINSANNLATSYFIADYKKKEEEDRAKNLEFQKNQEEYQKKQEENRQAELKRLATNIPEGYRRHAAKLRHEAQENAQWASNGKPLGSLEPELAQRIREDMQNSAVEANKSDIAAYDFAIKAYEANPTDEGLDEFVDNLYNRSLRQKGLNGIQQDQSRELANQQAYDNYLWQTQLANEQREAMAERLAMDRRPKIITDNAEEQFRNIQKVRR